MPNFVTIFKHQYFYKIFMTKFIYSFIMLVALVFSGSIQAQDAARTFRGAKVAPTSKMFGREAVKASQAASGLKSKAKARKVPMKAGDGTTLYGEVVYSDLMTEDLSWGLYSFPAKENLTLTQVYKQKAISANGGGAYNNGKLYFTSYYDGGFGTIQYLYFCTLDLNTMQLDSKALPADTYTSICLDMTFDPISNELYAQAYTDDAATSEVETYTLSIMNVGTGRTTPIARLDRMSTIACDIAGNMYGVRYSDGMFCKIDKATAKVSPIGSTGISPKYMGSSTFDYETGKLYWVTENRSTEKSGLYEIDVKTGKASLISNFPNNEQITSLYLPQSTNVFNLPNPTVEANFAGSNTSGSVTITAPAVDKNGAAITGDVTLSTYIDGSLAFTDQVAPGKSATHDLTLTQGNHKAEAVASHASIGKSERVGVTFYVGIDGPGNVSNFTLKRNGDKAELTWEQPTAGEHGGPINPALVYYELYRQPGNVLVSDGVTGTSYTETIRDNQFRYYSYTLVGYYKGVKGASTTSNSVAFGEATEIPFSTGFDTQAQFDAFSVVNSNNDDGYWYWEKTQQMAVYKYNTFNKADDWLISPALKLEAAKSYKLRFKAASTSRLYPETLEVKLGTSTEAKDFNVTLVPATDIAQEAMQEFETTITVDTDGIYFVGFHAISAKGLYYLFLDDVSVDFGPNKAAPSVVTDAKATQGANGAKDITISFKTPAVTFGGSNLTELTAVNIYNGTTAVKEFANPAIGAELSFTDENPAAGKNTYSIVAVNTAGKSIPVEVEGWSGNDVPGVPTDVKLLATDTKTAVLSWTAPKYGANGGTMDASQLTYNIYDSSNKKVASAIKTTSFTVSDINSTDGQVSLAFEVEAVNAAGTGERANSNSQIFGEAYKNSFAESFAGGELHTKCWTKEVIDPSPFSNEFYGRYWGLKHTSKWDRGPVPAAQDGDNGYLIAYTDYINVESRYVSPKINMADVKNPVLSFWFYHYFNPDTENGYSHYNETMTPEIRVDGATDYVALSKPIHLMNGNGWYRYDILLSDYIGKKDFQIAFKAHNYLSYDMHIDNITISGVKDKDITVTGIDAPEKIAVGSTRQVAVTVRNNGAVAASNYQVQLLRDGNVVATQDADEALAFGAEKTFAFDVTPSIADAGNTYKYKAQVIYSGDEDDTNNASAEATVSIPGNGVPVVTDLKAVYADGKVNLSWSEPADSESHFANEGFETYEAFTISDFGKWGLYDGDKVATYEIANSGSETKTYDYPNAGSMMAFQVFNPSKIKLTSPLWQPYLGEQMAVCFDAASSVNNDWLVSPQVKGGSTVKLMARSVTDSYGLEKFFFKYSTTDADTANFVTLGKKAIVPAKWTEYEFKLPENAKYFAINCVSANSYALLIDDIRYESVEPISYQLKGFNVYRNGEKNNNAIVEEGEYTDANVDNGSTYSYNVTALYDHGESDYSNTVQVVCSGVEAIGANLPVVYASHGVIYVKDAAGKDVTVYNTTGQAVYEQQVENSAAISVADGVYIVKVGTAAVKVAVR